MPRGRAPQPSVRDQAERDRLIEQFQYLPKWIVSRHYRSKVIKTLGKADAEAFGMLGLIRAAELWDPSRMTKGKPVRFITYATRAVWQTMCRYATQSHLIRVPAKPFAAGVRPPHWCRRTDPGAPPHGLPVEPLAPSLKELAIEPEHLAKALARLPQRERYVIECLYWKDQTLEDVGKVYGLTRERIRQIEEHALKRLHRELGSYKPRSFLPRHLRRTPAAS